MRKEDEFLWRTPLVEVWIEATPVMVKMESANPSGSHKDRPIRFLIQSLRSQGAFGSKQVTIIVSSSGNTGYAIAYYTADQNVKVIVVTDTLSPQEHREALKRFSHVRVIVVDKADATGSHISERFRIIAKLKNQIGNAIVVDQYGDARFPLAYEQTLAQEIDEETHGEPCTIFVAVGTCASAAGLLDYREKHNVKWTIFFVDAEGSALFSNPNGVKRRLSGYGNGQKTRFAIRCIGHGPVISVPDVEAVWMCRYLRWRRGLDIGPSSGAVAAAFRHIIRFPSLYPPLVGYPILIFPDSGHHYRKTIFNDDWLIENGLGGAIEGP
jgi:cysteine synthase